MRLRKSKRLMLILFAMIIMFSNLNTTRVYADEVEEAEEVEEIEIKKSEIIEFDKNNIIKLKVNKQPYKINYLEGDYFDPLGMEITLTDINNLTKIVGYYELNDYGIKISKNTSLKTSDNIIEIYKGDLKDYFKIAVAKSLVNKEILEMVRDIAKSLDTRNKTEESIKSLYRAIEYADDVLRYPSSTDKEIQSAINYLKRAINSVRDINLETSDFQLSIDSLQVGDKSLEGKTEPYFKISVRINRGRIKTIGADRKGDFSLEIDELKKDDKVEITVVSDSNNRLYKTLEISISEDKSITKTITETEENKKIREAIEFLEKQYSIGSSEKVDLSNISYSNQDFMKLFTTTNSNNKKDSLNYVFTNGKNAYIENYNGKSRSFTMDIEPIVKNSKLMLPLRYVSYSLDAKVYYKPTTKEVFLYKNGLTTYINAETGLGKNSNGGSFVIEKPLILNNRVLVMATDIPKIFSHNNIEIFKDNLTIYK